MGKYMATKVVGKLIATNTWNKPMLPVMLVMGIADKLSSSMLAK